MTKNPNDPWFPISVMLAVLLVIWLGVAGPILDDVTAKGLYGLLKDWQTLIGASIAVGAATIAYHNVTRQLRMTAKIREEDRMEAALPGLQEAEDLLVPLLNELRSLHGKQNANQIVQARLISPDETYAALARRKLPSADERMRREVASMMLRLRVASQQLANAYGAHQAAVHDLRDISNFAATEEDKLRDMELETREAIMLHTRSMDEAINSLKRLVMTYKNRAGQYAQMLVKFRDQIEAYLR